MKTIDRLEAKTNELKKLLAEVEQQLNEDGQVNFMPTSQPVSQRWTWLGLGLGIGVAIGATALTLG